MLALFYFIVGASFASFILCYEERRQKSLSQLERSHCMQCGMPIAPLYLIPILGYFLSRGHCKQCNAPIPIAFPCLEFIGGIVGLLLYFQATSIFEPLLNLMLAAVLLLMSLDDYHTQWIHDSDLWLYGCLILTHFFAFNTHYLSERIIGTLLVSLPLLLIRWRFPHTLGSGDIIFMALSGFYLGMNNIAYAFLFGILSALLYSIYLLLLKKATRESSIPLIPFLTIGVLMMMVL